MKRFLAVLLLAACIGPPDRIGYRISAGQSDYLGASSSDSGLPVANQTSDNIGFALWFEHDIGPPPHAALINALTAGMEANRATMARFVDKPVDVFVRNPSTFEPATPDKPDSTIGDDIKKGAGAIDGTDLGTKLLFGIAIAGAVVVLVHWLNRKNPKPKDSEG